MGTLTNRFPQAPLGLFAQLERLNAYGCRGNWAWGQANLHDYMAEPGGQNWSRSFYPNGDYQVYKYYYRNMTGHRVGTLPSSDLKLDAYGTVNSISLVC